MMNQKKLSPPQLQYKQQGVSLIEILVSVIVTGIGMLGVAALQNTSIKMSYDSLMRSQATFLYYDLADRMRANPTADYTLLSSTSLATAPSPVCQTSFVSCTPGEMKNHDLYYWWQAAVKILPNPQLSIAPPAGAANNLTVITIEWGDLVEPGTTGSGPTQTAARQKLEFQVEI